MNLWTSFHQTCIDALLALTLFLWSHKHFVISFFFQITLLKSLNKYYSFNIATL